MVAAPIVGRAVLDAYKQAMISALPFLSAGGRRETSAPGCFFFSLSVLFTF